MSITVRTVKGPNELEMRFPFTIEDANSAIRELNGGSTNSVSLERDSNSLLIGNGPDEFTVTFIVGEMEHAYDLVGNAEAEGRKEIMLGELTNWPIRFLVSRDVAERVAVEFVETGRVKLGPDWEDQHTEAS